MKGDVVLAVHVVVAGVVAEEFMEIFVAFGTEEGAHGEVAEDVFGPDVDAFVFVALVWDGDAPVEVTGDGSVF